MQPPDWFIDTVFHRGPCHTCRVCGLNECYVWHEDDSCYEVHVCPRDNTMWWAVLFDLDWNDDDEELNAA